MEGRVYSVTVQNAAFTNSTNTGTICQIATPSTIGVEIIRAWCSQITTTTSAQQAIQLAALSTASTVTTFTPIAMNKNDPASLCVGGAALTGTLGTAEGAVARMIVSDAFSLLNGWLWVPTPTDRPTIAASTFFVLRFPATIATITIDAGIVFKELL